MARLSVSAATRGVSIDTHTGWYDWSMAQMVKMAGLPALVVFGRVGVWIKKQLQESPESYRRYS